MSETQRVSKSRGQSSTRLVRETAFSGSLEKYPVSAPAWTSSHVATPFALGGLVQPKVVIGRINDPYEHEADQVADRVTSGVGIAPSSISRVYPGNLGPPAQRQAEPETEEEEEEKTSSETPVQPQAADSTEAEEEPEEETEEEAPETVQTLAVQSKADDLQIQTVQRQAEAEEEKEEPVQTQAIQPQEEEKEEEPVQELAIQRQEEEEKEEEPVQELTLQRQEEEREEEVQEKPIQRQEGEEKEEEPVQEFAVQRQAEEEEKPVQELIVQRKDSEKDESVQSGSGTGSGSVHSPLAASAASRAIQSKGAGAPLQPQTRSTLEKGMGVDLGDVRVHEDSSAHKTSADLKARAFTHKNHIWLGRGQTQNNLRLMAHETTHVLQQGGVVRRKPLPISSVSPRIQGGWLGKAWDAVSGAPSVAVEWAGESLSAGIDYIKEKALDFVQAIPGYSLLTVVIGRDPISGASVSRNGRNFIEAGLDIIPNGRSLKDKLEKEGALGEAAHWLDEQIALLDISASEIGKQLKRFWDSLSLADVARLEAVLGRLANIFKNPIQKVIQFAGNVAIKLLKIIKDYVISSLITFIKKQTSAYPLLTVILRRDPISGKAVKRTPMALLRGFMQLSKSGAEQLRQMEESGSLQRVANWLNRAVKRLNLSPEVIVSTFRKAWDLITIENLMHPIDTFLGLYEIFEGPVSRIINFVAIVAIKVLKFIKDALISRLIKYARTIRGYTLLTVILGKDPFSEEPVERNAENIIHGFMSLMEAGEQQFKEMKKTGAIDRLTSRIEGAIARLNFTWDYIRNLFITAWESFSLKDLAAPIAAFKKLMNIFGEPLGRLINFVGEIIKLVIEVALKLMNFPVDLISNIVTKAMQAIEDIKRDPIGFLKNLMLAVKTGFMKFFDNIGTHLLNGLMKWLFRELEDAGITPPPDLSLKSILGLVMQVLGITVEKIWQKLGEKIGKDRVARIRGMIDRLTGIWTFVKDVMTRGPVAIWEYIKEKISNLWDTVLNAIKEWIVTKIIERVTVKLLSMLDPTGIMAVVNGFIAFYNAVQSFIRYLRELLEIVNSFVVGVAEIARGSVGRAADFLEGALARAVPVAIGFLANQVGLSGLGKRIGEMIGKVQKMVDKALDWLIDKAVSLGTGLLSMAKSAVGAVKDWWKGKKEVTTQDGQKHDVYFRGSGSSARLMIASVTPKDIDDYLKAIKKAHKLSDTDIKPTKDKLTLIESEISSNKSDEQKAASISKYFNELIAEIAKIKLNQSVDASGSTEPVYGPLYGGFGSLARVDQIAFGISGGSIADRNLYNDNFRILERRRRGDRPLYARGHLLNADLGGPGDDWRNLTPLSYSGNKLHSSRFESKVKDKFKPTTRIENFKVQPIYGRPVNPIVSKLENYSMPYKGLSKKYREKLSEVIKAEATVPTELDCHADVVESAKTEKIDAKVPNKIYDEGLASENLKDYKISY